MNRSRQASLSITNSWSSPKPMSIESVMPYNHLILCRPLLLLPSTFPSIRVFSRESVLPIRWPKYWSFSFSISASNKHPGLIAFRMDWLDRLAVQGALKSLPQHQTPKNPLQCSQSVILGSHAGNLYLRDQWNPEKPFWIETSSLKAGSANTILFSSSFPFGLRSIFKEPMWWPFSP